MLTAHNGKHFDMPIILRDLKKYGDIYRQFKDVPILFVDSLKMLQNKLNGKSSNNKNVSLTLGSVYRNTFISVLNAWKHKESPSKVSKINPDLL